MSTFTKHQPTPAPAPRTETPDDKGTVTTVPHPGGAHAKVGGGAFSGGCVPGDTRPPDPEEPPPDEVSHHRK